VGGGVAGLEALVALRRLAGPRVTLELITPEPVTESCSTSMAKAFEHRRPIKTDVAEVAEATGARLVIDSVIAVDASNAAVTLAGGETRSYDRLLVTVGARAEESIAGALTFGAPGGAGRFRRLLQYAQTAEVGDVVFAVPALVGLPLTVYQLCMLTAHRVRAASVPPHMTLLTPERAPLIDFGASASATVASELAARDVHVITGVTPDEIAWGELRCTPGKVKINADIVVTLPRMRGPALAGLPADEHGFIVVDDFGLVRGADNVYAAGDATTLHTVKHGQLAAQQALVAAESIAASVGVPLAPRPFRPSLDGILSSDPWSDRVSVGAGGVEAPLPARAEW
jgi:sulfide:quinone oxidoreductase